VVFGYPKIYQHSYVFPKPVFDRAKKEQVVRVFFRVFTDWTGWRNTFRREQAMHANSARDAID
jgi:hypothetical protein